MDALRRGAWATALGYLRRRSGRRALLLRAGVLPFLPGSLRRTWARRHAREWADRLLPSYLTRTGTWRHETALSLERYSDTLVRDDYETGLHRWLSEPAAVASAQGHRQLARHFGVDLVSPLLCRRVLELCLGIPPQMMFSQRYDKAFLRGALAGRVPEAFRVRPKDNRLWRVLRTSVLTSAGARRALQDEHVRERLADWVRFERVEATLDALARGAILPDRLLLHLEGLVMFAQWYGMARRDYGVR